MHVEIFCGSHGTCLTWSTSGQGLPLSHCLLTRNGVKYLKSESVILPTAVNGIAPGNAFRGCKIVKYFPHSRLSFQRASHSQHRDLCIPDPSPFPALPSSSQLFPALPSPRPSLQNTYTKSGCSPAQEILLVPSVP